MTALADRRCAPCDADTPALDTQAIQNHLDMISDRWEIDADGRLVARLKFKNYYRTQAFVNAVAYIAHRESHHPDISFGYNTCRIELITHAIDGLSDNDFISAAKIDALLD